MRITKPYKLDLKGFLSHVLMGALFLFFITCTTKEKGAVISEKVTAEMILGDSTYLAISYGGYRTISRDTQPTIAELKEDMLLLSAMGFKLIRTYNVQLPHAGNVLKAISELKKENPDFEMYVMLGAWIDCKNAWTGKEPDHNQESEQNAGEIARAASLANQYPEIVKIIAVGNEAMVKWATSYYVQPGIILKWVNHLQDLKKKGKLDKELWITSSDNFASWGGGSEEYHVEDLISLIEAVDFISMHTYPMHDTHYNPDFWKDVSGDPENIEFQIQAAMLRAKEYAISQYKAVKDYMKSIGADKPIHIGETGWASHSDGFYGPEGSMACDEYKQALYYNHMRDWTNGAGMSCFYFEAFDESWKDAGNVHGSENYFGLFTIDGKAKYVLWDEVDKGIFDGLSRGGNAITKTFGGDKSEMMKTLSNPAMVSKKLMEQN